MLALAEKGAFEAEDRGFLRHFSNIARFEPWAENPRVSGSISPLATIKSKTRTRRGLRW
jgi:hypothetical protein